MTRNINIDATRIVDYDSFHDVFEETFGFPGYYGRNMNAWIDCMSYLDEPDSGMTSVHVGTGDVVVLCIASITGLKQRLPDVYNALVECSSFVNYRRIEKGLPAVLALSFYA